MIWYFMCFRGECSFDSYTLSLNDSDYFYECPRERIYKSKCASMYSEWKLSKDCEWGPVSFVYYNNIVFRNYFCAICDVNYPLEYGETVTSGSLEDLFAESVYVSLRSYITTIRLSFNWQCCGRCVQDFQPACSKIDNSTSVLPQLISEELVNSTVFTNSFLITDLCGEEMHQCFQIEANNYSISNPPINNTLMPGSPGNSKSVGRLVFGVARYPQQEQTTPVQMWRSSNDSIMFCSNKSVISQLSNQAYKHIQLSANGLQVGFLLFLLSHSLISSLKCSSKSLLVPVLSSSRICYGFQL